MAPLDTPLEIAECRLHEVAIPLVEPFRLSGGAMRTRRSLVVELVERCGAVGYGESAPFAQPFYSEETLDSAGSCIRQHLLPRLRGEAFPNLEQAARVLERGVRGNRIARAGVETALWDLLSAKAATPLRALLADALRRLGVAEEWRRSADAVESGVALGIPEDGEPGTLAERARAAIERGYRRVKIKVQPGWDVAAVGAVRQAAQLARREVGVWADANGGYSRDGVLAALRALDGMRLVMIEQPLPPEDVVGTLALSRMLRTPLCLDESLTDDRAAELFVEQRGPTIWNLKVQRVGGLWESLRIYRRAVAAGVQLWAGSMPETGVGVHAIASLASFSGFVLPTDVEPSERWYEAGTDLIDWRMDADGRIPVNDAPGLWTLGLRERLGRVGKAVA